MAIIKRSKPVDVLLVGPIPRAESYVGGIAMLIITQLEKWQLRTSVAHFNTQLWARDFGSTGRLRLSHIFAFFINAFRLAWVTACVRPVIVHFHSSIQLALLKDLALALGVRWIYRRKVVFQIHYAMAESILLSRSHFLRRCQLRLLMRGSDRIAFLSRNVIDDLAAMLPPKAASALRLKSCILPNFTEIPANPDRHPEVAKPLRIFFIGNVGRRKGVYDLIYAAQEMRKRSAGPFRMEFAGPFDAPEDKQQLTSLVSELGLDGEIVFLGPITGAAKAAAFRNAAVFALPSYGEGVPISLLEAMSYGLPVVVTNVGGIPETITNGREGFLLCPGNVGALAAALIQLAESPELRRQMGLAARARAEERYSVQAFFKELQGLYQSLGCCAETH